MPFTRRSRGVQLALTCVALATMSGCGFIFSKAPPVGHEQMDYFTCTESNTGPVLDIVWGSLNLLGVLTIAADPDAYEEMYGVDATSGIVVGLTWTGVSAAAAATGFKRSKQCRAAKLDLAQRQAQHRTRTVVPVAAEAATAPVVQAVVLNPQADTLPVGATLQLTATAYHSSGVAIPDRTFTWSSSNDAVASVSNVGLVTANAPGLVTIAANTGNVVGITRLTIVE